MVGAAIYVNNKLISCLEWWLLGMYKHTHTHTPTHKLMHTHTQTHTHTHACMHTHTYTPTWSKLQISKRCVEEPVGWEMSGWSPEQAEFCRGACAYHAALWEDLGRVLNVCGRLGILDDWSSFGVDTTAYFYWLTNTHTHFYLCTHIHTCPCIFRQKGCSFHFETYGC